MSNQEIRESIKFGIFWVTVSTVFIKILSLISQIVLGYVLSVETFAIFALVNYVLSFFVNFYNQGIGKYLIQKQNKRFENFYNFYKDFSLINSLIGILFACIFALIFGVIFNESRVVPLIIITSLSFPFIAQGNMIISDLSHKLRFKEINILALIKQAFYSILLIIFAFSGMDIYTMCLSFLLSSVIYYLILVSYKKKNFFKKNFKFRYIFYFYDRLKYLMIGGVLISLSTKAEILILNRIFTLEELGYYSFGILLATNLVYPIYAGISQVFLPVFSGIKDNKQNFFSQYLDQIKIALLLCILTFSLLAFFVRDVIFFIWGEKWLGSYIVIFTMLLAMPLRVCWEIAHSGLETLGRWDLKIKLVSIDIIITLIAAYSGFILNGFLGVIVAIFLQRSISTIYTLICFYYLENNKITNNIKEITIFCVIAFLYSMAILLTELHQNSLPIKFGYLSLIILFFSVFYKNDLLKIMKKRNF